MPEADRSHASDVAAPGAPTGRSRARSVVRGTPRSAGTAPKDQLNPVAVEAMREVGVDIANESPKVLTDQAVQVSDVVITMGCGDTCPFYPGTRYLDWQLDDPAGQSIEAVRPIRDEIKSRVEQLIGELLPERATA